MSAGLGLGIAAVLGSLARRGRSAVDAVALDPAERKRRELAREVREWNEAIDARRRVRKGRHG